MNCVSGHCHPVSIALYGEKMPFGPCGAFDCSTPSGHWGRNRYIAIYCRFSIPFLKCIHDSKNKKNIYLIYLTLWEFAWLQQHMQCEEKKS